MQEKNFGYLGFSFQQSLIKAIIEDKKYGETIIDVLESKYFENQSFRYIMENLKEFYTKYNKIPDYQTVAQKITAETGNVESSQIHLDTLQIIKESNLETSYVKDTAMNFCKQQNLKRELKIVSNIIESGEFESYSKIEKIIQNALQVGIHSDDATDIFHDIDAALEKNAREAIPTGIVGMDNLLKGGLGRGELGVILAPTGTGKTTLLTKIANTAYNYNFNVLQIFFEDNHAQIRLKHFTIWTGISPDEQLLNVDAVKEKVKEAEERSTGNIRLLKFPSDSISVSDIKSKIRKMISDGFKIDLLVLDYVDCISPERSTDGEEWKGEGSIMRSLEAMTSEFNIAIWTATQGNRNSISSEIVNSDQMGGSIKKAQIAHVIISIAKTIEQKEHKLATLTLLKSRIGQDGVVFQNCKFDNEYLEINTDTQNTLLGHQEERQQNNQNRAREAFLQRQQIGNRR